jgi:predicted DNA binding CopG/RHH family protein
MKRRRKTIPVFRNEDEEFQFWSTHDSVDLILDTEEVKQPFKMKKKQEKTRITMLLDRRLKSQLEKIAQEKGIPYQTLIQLWLKEKVHQEIRKRLAS